MSNIKLGESWQDEEQAISMFEDIMAIFKRYKLPMVTVIGVLVSIIKMHLDSHKDCGCAEVLKKNIKELLQISDPAQEIINKIFNRN